MRRTESGRVMSEGGRRRSASSASVAGYITDSTPASGSRPFGSGGDDNISHYSAPSERGTENNGGSNEAGILSLVTKVVMATLRFTGPSAKVSPTSSSMYDAPHASVSGQEHLPQPGLSGPADGATSPPRPRAPLQRGDSSKFMRPTSPSQVLPSQQQQQQQLDTSLRGTPAGSLGPGTQAPSFNSTFAMSWSAAFMTSLNNLGMGGGTLTPPSTLRSCDFFPHKGSLTGGFELEDVLGSKQATDAFMTYATDKFCCPEKVSFLLDLMEFETLPEDEDIRLDCNRLLTTYIRKGAAQDIGLGTYVRQSTFKRTEEYLSMCAAASAQREVMEGEVTTAAGGGGEEEEDERPKLSMLTMLEAREHVFALAKADVKDYLSETVLPGFPESEVWKELLHMWDKAKQAEEDRRANRQTKTTLEIDGTQTQQELHDT